jgi:hypothetical protein
MLWMVDGACLRCHRVDLVLRVRPVVASAKVNAWELFLIADQSPVPSVSTRAFDLSTNQAARQFQIVVGDRWYFST